MCETRLVTGITGQDGAYLAELLLSRGYEVHGIVRRSSTESAERIQHVRDRLVLHQADLLDQLSIVPRRRCRPTARTVQSGRPELCAHKLRPAVAHGEIYGTWRHSHSGSHPVGGSGIRFYQASTSEMFGNVPEEPQNEKTPFRPRSPYGVAKVYGHWITVNFRESYDIFACSGILFNHESPRRGLEFVTRKISNSVARIKQGVQEQAETGQSRSTTGLGICGRLRRSHVVDAATGRT